MSGTKVIFEKLKSTMIKNSEQKKSSQGFNKFFVVIFQVG